MKFIFLITCNVFDFIELNGLTYLVFDSMKICKHIAQYSAVCDRVSYFSSISSVAENLFNWLFHWTFIQMLEEKKTDHTLWLPSPCMTICTTLNHESTAVVWLYKCWVFINYVFLLMYHSCLKFRSKLTNVNDTFWRKFFASIILYFLYDHVSM